MTSWSPLFVCQFLVGAVWSIAPLRGKNFITSWTSDSGRRGRPDPGCPGCPPGFLLLFFFFGRFILSFFESVDGGLDELLRFWPPGLAFGFFQLMAELEKLGNRGILAH